MSIEPIDAYTVCSHPVSPPKDRPQTLAEYKAKMMARFGWTKMPSADFLAARENRLMWKMNPGPNWDSAKNATEGNKKRVKAGRWYFVDHEERRKRVYAVLPATTREVAAEIGVSTEVAQCALRELRQRGAVTSRRWMHTTLWEPVKVAAE